MPLLSLRRVTQPSSFRGAVMCGALGCALAIMLVTAATPARAGDDDSGSTEAPDIKFLRNFLEGLGLQDGRGSTINYQERAPLVIPPNLSLPPTETDAVAKNPNWPVDPEVKARKQIEAWQRTKVNDSSEAVDAQRRPLPPSQLDVGPRRNSPKNAGAMSPEDSERPFSPSALGYKGSLWNTMFGKKDDQNARFTGEPARASLTDPPPGYQTPSPEQPYGKPTDDNRPKATDYLTEHGTADMNH